MGLHVLSESTADAEIMVLLSDGEPDSIKKTQNAAEVAGQKGIQLFAVGIGKSYNADQLLRLVAPCNGAVFGDSDADKISEIFYDLINRIDRIIATNVRLDFTFDERVQCRQVFKTSPERALLDSSTFTSDTSDLALRVGNIEDNKVYEFLLQVDVGRIDVGTIELITARLQYDINHLGLDRQTQEIVLTANFSESDSLQSGTGKKIGSALKIATMMQLSDDLMQSFSNSDNDLALQTIDELQQHCEEENNTALQQNLENMKVQLERGQGISGNDRNDFLLASTTAPPKAPFFDLILIDPGSDTIRLLREIRNATGMGMREISDIIRRRNSVVTFFKNETSAKSLQQRLASIGAKVEIQARENVEEDT